MRTLNLPYQAPLALRVSGRSRVQATIRAMSVAMLLALCVTVPALAAEPAAQPSDATYALHEGKSLQLGSERQVLSGDFTVEAGQVVDDDVFVYSGNVEVHGGGKITGDLIVFSGNIQMDEGSEVGGDVTNYSGNVEIAGNVGGDLTVWSGDVELSSSAVVGGDISVASGNLDRAEGSSVEGNVLNGPQFHFPGGLGADATKRPGRPGVSFGPQPQTFFGRVLGLLGRLFIAALMTAFAMLLVGGLFYIRPQLIVDTRKQLREQLALSAVVGGIANLLALFLAGLLAMTICLLPLALIPLLVLFAVNIVGWAVASQIAGERIASVSKRPIQPILTILVGALFLSGLCALLWAFGGCFRAIAFIVIFAVSSLGAGAVLSPWVNRKPSPSKGNGTGGNGSDGGATATRGPTSPAGSPGAASPTQDVPVEFDVAAPIDYITAEEVNASQKQNPTSGAADAGAAGSTATAPVAKDEPVELDVAGPIDYITAQEVNAGDVISSGDDFSSIKGIGPIYARRLKESGFTTFAQLAAASVDEVAAAIGWPADRVRKAEVIDQAKVLAQKS